MKGRGGEIVGSVKQVIVEQHGESKLGVGSPGRERRGLCSGAENQSLNGRGSRVETVWREREGVQDLAYVIIKVIDDEEVGDEGREMCRQNIGRKEDYISFLNRFPWIHDVLVQG